MDLSPFAGHTIDVHFTTWQDGAVTHEMMYVDNIEIPEIGFFDDVESGEGDWTSTGWSVTDGMLDNGFGVITVNTKFVPAERYPEPATHSGTRIRSTRTMDIDLETQYGESRVPAAPAESGRVMVSITANHVDHIMSADYEFNAIW